jgi:transposase-like protein
MKKKRNTPEQIVQKLRAIEAEIGQGKSTGEACKPHGITEATYYRWKQQYAGMSLPTVKKLKQLEKENADLKKLVAEQALDLRMLKEIATGKW